MCEFENIWVFILLPLPLLMLLIPRYNKKKVSLRIPLGMSQSIQELKLSNNNRNKIKSKSIVDWLIIIIIWILLIVSLASPFIVGKSKQISKTGRNILMVSDISLSMQTSDFYDKEGNNQTRWEVCKEVMNDFIKRRKGDRVGLIVFGSQAYTQTPFTEDINSYGRFLNQIEVGMAGQMTAINSAIALGIDLFEKDKINKRIMILLTDGVDSKSSVSAINMAKLAKEKKVIIYTIGVGGSLNSNSDLDEKTLKEISDVTGGKYFLANDRKEMEGIYKSLDKLEPMEYKNSSYCPKTKLFYYPLISAFCLSFIHIVLKLLFHLIKK
ncbi:VWA domain-containing protein [Marinilabiliaceae bacterium JC040]|nr:VWA domain-containing protein [Marinilabiliaceae bacterium JC040]